MNRRRFITTSLAGTLATGTAAWLFMRTSGNAAPGEFEIQKTEAEWRAELTEMEYAVLREEATERAYTSPLLEEKRMGTFNCAGCDLPL